MHKPIIFSVALLVIAPPSFASFVFDLGISEELYVRPGDTVNLPARFKNTGTEVIEFRTIWNFDDVGRFVNQFNGVVVNPGETFDFILGSLSVSPSAPIGASQGIFQRLLGVGFSDGTTLESGHIKPPIGLPPYEDINDRTRITIAGESFITPLDRYSRGQPGWFSHGRPDIDKAWIGIISYSNFDFGSVQLSPNPAGFIPEVRSSVIPEPSSFILLGLGLLAAVGRRRFRLADPASPA